MRRISVAERRARLGARHHLAAGALAGSPVEVASSLVAVHSTDPSSVYAGMVARMAAGGIAAIERALYGDKTLLRLLGMRRTVFVTTLDIAPVIQAACADAVAARERRKLLSWLAASGTAGDDPRRWLAGAEQAALAALADLGEATAAELAARDPRLAGQIVLSPGKSYEGRQNLASRVLFLLAAEGKVVRGRPRGSWASHQYRWSLLSRWCPQGLAAWSAEDAEAELARRWLAAYGPATVDDLRWWAGWGKAQTRRALARIRPAEIDLHGEPGIMLPGDDPPPRAPAPWVALLPALDSTPMGWQRREWFLGPHGPRLFDTTGNIGPTLWCDGRIAGAWAQDRAGDVVCRFFEDAGADAVAAAQHAARRLSVALGGARLAARTRGLTWFERELAGGPA